MMERARLVAHCKKIEKKARGCDKCRTEGRCYRLIGVVLDEDIECGIFVCGRCGYIKASGTPFTSLVELAPERLRCLLHSSAGPYIEQELREIRLEL